jgi:hypothetical protein
MKNPGNSLSVPSTLTTVRMTGAKRQLGVDVSIVDAEEMIKMRQLHASCQKMNPKIEFRLLHLFSKPIYYI